MPRSAIRKPALSGVADAGHRKRCDGSMREAPQYLVSIDDIRLKPRLKSSVICFRYSLNALLKQGLYTVKGNGHRTRPFPLALQEYHCQLLYLSFLLTVSMLSPQKYYKIKSAEILTSRIK